MHSLPSAIEIKEVKNKKVLTEGKYNPKPSLLGNLHHVGFVSSILEVLFPSLFIVFFNIDFPSFLNYIPGVFCKASGCLMEDLGGTRLKM